MINDYTYSMNNENHEDKDYSNIIKSQDRTTKIQNQATKMIASFLELLEAAFDDDFGKFLLFLVITSLVLMKIIF